jgi:hypothetical protein
MKSSQFYHLFVDAKNATFFTAEGPSTASVHIPDKESEQGSSSVSSAHTVKETDKGSIAGKARERSRL